jgi:hypothetical protein
MRSTTKSTMKTHKTQIYVSCVFFVLFVVD